MTVTIFRIYCGLNEPNGDNSLAMCHQRGGIVNRLAGILFQGFTSYSATGCWKDEAELTTIIEVMCQESELRSMSQTVRNFAACYKNLANQESVMIIKTECEGDFV